jgi:hypothetical protein
MKSQKARNKRQASDNCPEARASGSLHTPFFCGKSIWPEGILCRPGIR